MALCKKCGEDIIWMQQDSGKWVPFNSMMKGGKSHFETCQPNPELAEKIRRYQEKKPKMERLQIGEDEFI